MIEARINTQGLGDWFQVTIANYNSTTGIFHIVSKESASQYFVRRCDLRDGNNGADILDVIALLTRDLPVDRP